MIRYIVLLMLFIFTLYAKEIAIVKSVKGEVISKTSDSYERVSSGEVLESDMILITKDNSSAVIIFKDSSTVVLGANSILKLERFVFEPTENKFDFSLSLDKGSLSFESGKISELSPESFELKTPEGAIAIRGTKFFVKVQ